jgi:hypothetical protein
LVGSSFLEPLALFEARVLKVASQWIRREDRIQVSVEAEHVKDRRVSADRDAGPAFFNASKGHP